MNAETYYSLANYLAIGCWLVLAASLFLPVLRNAARAIGRYGLPLLLGFGYLLIVLVDPDDAAGGFGSLAEVRVLFSSDWLLLAGWLHYLVFDYFVGSWMAFDSLDRNVNRIMVLPCLFLCLMAGPAGLLLYLAIREGSARANRKTRA